MTMREGNKKLKVCPFCGSRARIFRAANGNYGVECDKIGCVMRSHMAIRSGLRSMKRGLPR